MSLRKKGGDTGRLRQTDKERRKEKKKGLWEVANERVSDTTVDKGRERNKYYLPTDSRQTTFVLHNFLNKAEILSHTFGKPFGEVATSNISWYAKNYLEKL